MSKPLAGLNFRASACRYWRPEGLAGVDLFWAALSRHQFCRHGHEGYAVGAVEQGAHAIAARGRLWVARRGDVITVNPEDIHDGGPPAAGDTYTYRVIYFDPPVLRGFAVETAGKRVDMPFFSASVVRDPPLAEQILRLHAALDDGNSLLERESRLLGIMLRLLLRHAKEPPEPVRVQRADRRIETARDYLDQCFSQDISLAELAALAGLDRFRLLRKFRQSLGLPPHAYQTQRRLRQARVLLLGGESPAIAAAAVGFADQSHLIRKFKAAYGITPGQFLGQARRRSLQ